LQISIIKGCIIYRFALLFFLISPLVSNAGARDIEKIQHIIFIIKENRTFDNYFGTFPGADGATSGTISTGQTIALGHTPDRTGHDIDHSYEATIKAMDNGKMDQFDLIGGGNKNGEMLAYTQMTGKDIPNYFAYAKNFVLADHMFSSLTGPSFPNHLYTIGAQSAGAINNPKKPQKPGPKPPPKPGAIPFRAKWGCDAEDRKSVV